VPAGCAHLPAHLPGDAAVNPESGQTAEAPPRRSGPRPAAPVGRAVDAPVDPGGGPSRGPPTSRSQGPRVSPAPGRRRWATRWPRSRRRAERDCAYPEALNMNASVGHRTERLPQCGTPAGWIRTNARHHGGSPVRRRWIRTERVAPVDRGEKSTKARTVRHCPSLAGTSSRQRALASTLMGYKSGIPHGFGQSR